MITMSDVAKAANVSVMTVSRVLNNSGYVKKETREAIERAIKELDYRPNLIAKSLVTGKSKIIAYVLSDISDQFYGSVCKGVESACFERGYTALICNAETTGSVEKYIDMIADRKLDGAIFHHLPVSLQQIQWLEEQGIQCITVDNEFELEQVSSLDSDDYMGAFQAVIYLKERGYSQIASICGEDTCSINPESTYLERYQHKIWRKRTAGYLEGLKKEGLSSAGIYYGRGSAEMQTSFESGKKAMKELLEAEVKPDAVYCQSDILALGAADILYQRENFTKNKIAIMGHDGLDICRLRYPHISTVVQPKYEMGIEATKMLLDKIQNNNKGVEHKILKSYIYKGDTC